LQVGQNVGDGGKDVTYRLVIAVGDAAASQVTDVTFEPLGAEAGDGVVGAPFIADGPR
jgi:hypothetical protein